MAHTKDRVVRQKQSWKALVNAVDPKKPKNVKYRFSNDRTFKERS